MVIHDSGIFVDVNTLSLLLFRSSSRASPFCVIHIPTFLQDFLSSPSSAYSLVCFVALIGVVSVVLAHFGFLLLTIPYTFIIISTRLV